MRPLSRNGVRRTPQSLSTSAAGALRLSIDQLVGPIVLGSAARVRPVVVMFCFLGGGALFGIVGVILAVPIALAVKVSLSVLYREAG